MSVTTNEYIPDDATGEVSNSESQSHGAAAYVRSKYQEAESDRNVHEYRWLRSFDQFRGNYSVEERDQLSRLKERNPFASEAFIKITKTKTLAAIGSLYEVITAGNKVPIGVEETPEPEGIAKKVHIDLSNQEDSIAVDSTTVDDMASAIGFPGDGKDIPRGTTFKDLFGGLGDKYARLFKDGTLLRQGDSPDPVNAIEVHPAKEAAQKMNNFIQDQLQEADAIAKIKEAIWEMSVLGTGVIKGPFTDKEEIPSWTKNPETGKMDYTPKYKLRPYLQQASVWNIYPDPNAEKPEDLDFVVERHKMSKAKLQTLRSQPGFDATQIEIVLRSSGGVNIEEWESRLKDFGQNVAMDDRYEVLEFWGNVDYGRAKEWGIKGLPEETSDYAQVQVCLWAVNGRCIKKCINPFTPERIPYFFLRYEEQPYQVWGIGVPENMQDAQGMINVHTRAAQDNLRLAGSCMLEVNETQLAPGQDSSIYAGKVWRKQGGAPGQSVYSISFNNTAPAHLQFIGEANRWADQSSGIPSIMHGQTGVTGTGRSAFGLSAIMNSGSLSIRTVVQNLDRDLLKPLGQALFNWNMQFNSDEAPEIVGDLKIIAKGTSALAMKEVQSQRLLSLLQIAGNPLVAPFINVPNILKDLAVSLDLDPNDVINDPDTAKLYAQIIGEQANVNFGSSPETQTGTPQIGPQGGGEPSGAPDANNVAGVGGGNLGVPASPNTG